MPKLVSGAGFLVIYESDYEKFEWSNQKNYLRRTVWKRTEGYQGLSKEEELYVKVSDLRERERIKRTGEFHLVIEGQKIREVTLFKQTKRNGWSRQPTGYYKIHEEVRDEKGMVKYLMRYYKRVRG